MEYVQPASLQAAEDDDDWEGPGFVYEYAVGGHSGGRNGEWLVPPPQHLSTSIHRKCSMDEKVVIRSLLHAFLDFFALGWTHTWISRLLVPVTRLWERSQKRITVALAPKPPVNRLPPELLSRIFATYLEDCKPPKDITKHKGDVNWRVGLCQLPTVTPLQLTGVCQYWREVALSTPTLWSTIYVDRPNLPEHVHSFSMWLDNSAPAPLDLTYNQPRPLYFENDGGGRSNTATSILKAMLGQLRRWRSARIFLKQDKRDLAKLASSDGFLQSLCPPAFLERFELELAGWDDEHALTLLGLLFSSPMLREVELHDPFSYPSSAAIQDAAWGRLSRITLHDTDVASLLGFLPFCQQLRHLMVCRLRCADVPADKAVISLPQLKKLNLDKATRLDVLFNHLDLPSLRKLVCENGEFSSKRHTQVQEEANWKSLLGMLERSKCTLKSFGWSCKQPYEFTEECLVRHLASPLFRGLQHLCLCRVSNLAITALRVTVKSSLLPQLSKIEFDYCFATDGTFTAMPTARFQLALDALLPILDASTPAELASRILVSFILYTLYAPHPIAVNPFKSAIFTTYQSEREKAVGFAYDGGTSSRVVSPDYSFERDKQNERLLQAVKLLLAARERVLNLAEVRALVPVLSEVATSRMVTSLDLAPIVAYNPTIAHPLFVGLVSNPNPESNNPMPFLEVLPYLPPTLPSFDLMGRLLRDQTFIKVAGYSTVADLVRIEVLGLFIQQCIHWIEQAEREQQQGLISDDRFEKGLQHLCRFFMSLIKLKIIDPRSDTDCAEMSTFCLHHARFEEANALYRVIMHGSNF
ncbi:hypothetical protein MD484_g4033, partial [Candolleomyces efflorescens]